MKYNRWHVYEEMKRNWRKNRKIMTLKEVVATFPRTKATEIIEGMIEFEIAWKSTFRHEELDIDAINYSFLEGA